MGMGKAATAHAARLLSIDALAKQERLVAELENAKREACKHLSASIRIPTIAKVSRSHGSAMSIPFAMLRCSEYNMCSYTVCVCI